MVKLTLIARVSDGLPLAEGLDSDKDHELANFKQQAKVSSMHASRCSCAQLRATAAVDALQQCSVTCTHTWARSDDVLRLQLCVLNLSRPHIHASMHDVQVLRCRACSRRWRRAARGSPSG